MLEYGQIAGYYFAN